MTLHKSKWAWMMDWCKSNYLNPSNKYHWQRAEQAYEKEQQE